MRVFVGLVLATALLVPVSAAQNPPGSKHPAAPSSSPPLPNAPASLDPSQPGEERVVFLRGRLATNDNTPVPSDAVVERVCNNKVRQQVYASRNGDFSMQLGSRADSFLDATGDQTSQSGAANKDSITGIPRRELMNCELRASAAGFHSAVISLVDLETFDGNSDVGVIVVERVAKIEGVTLSAEPYKAPKDARRAYEKGLVAERKADLASARKFFEMAVQIYPKYVSAWYQLGTVLQKEKQNEAARRAYTQSTSIDNRFLPPYLSLASIAYEEENWPLVLTLTDQVLGRDPLNHVDLTGYLLNLDPFNCTEAYFYNAAANFKLNKMEDAEKSGLKAEHADLLTLTRFPQLHLILGEIFARKNDYPTAISEIQTYLQLVPHAKNAEQVREELAKLEKLNGSVSTSEN